MAELVCVGQHQACVLRATRLDEDCTPLSGPTDAVIFAGIVDLSLTPVVKERTFLEPEDACGNILFVAETPEVVKRYDVTLNLAVSGFEAIELMTDAELIIGNATSPWEDSTIGVADAGLTTPSKPGFGLEVWVRATALGESGPCGPDETNPNWVRHVFPRVLLRRDARTFNNEVANYTFTGISTANSQFGDPWSDFPGVTVPNGSPHYEFYDTGIPTAECGYVSGS